MAGPALRTFTVAGVLTATAVFGGVIAVPVAAQPSDSDGSSQSADGPDSGSDPTDGGTGGDTGSDDDGGSSSEPEAPAEPTQGLPDDEPEQIEPTRIVESDPGAGTGGSRQSESVVESPRPAPSFRLPAPERNAIKLPFVRLPAAGEIPMGSWPTPSTFYTTVEIPVPTLTEFLRALQVVPAPAPPPGPAFRTQEEAPVADATTGTTTGGGGGGAGGAYPEAVVFRAPLVTVPRAGTLAGKPLRPAPQAPGATAAPNVTAPGVAGVRTPTIRGSVPPTPGATVAPPAVPAGGQAPRLGANPRGVTNPTVAQIAAVALPGVAGLMFLTFSGGVIGYRQANSTRFVRTAGAERFLP
ncbi:hypothetical protein ACTWP6_27705 [Mycobacterium sp. 4D054]|uniref:hypothetical protein n=1 Tax=unclassified Mycobacterium TaxID=2642494 RepID=UPI0021B226B2|nr:hypothetical protein [Mycobacterium sp. SMC-8]UXA13396.1 hypothetical protein KXD97_06115 [Mycobacterium sp. SMC-8]